MIDESGGLVEISTDGGCLGNPGPGGWAFAARFGGRTVTRSGFEPQTTNNRMELTAVREALREMGALGEWRGRPGGTTTDSTYVQRGISEWIGSWVRNGWRTAAKKPVKNMDLWMELLSLSKGLAISWKWVMGHSGDRWNELCHRMVEESINRRA